MLGRGTFTSQKHRASVRLCLPVERLVSTTAKEEVNSEVVKFLEGGGALTIMHAIVIRP